MKELLSVGEARALVRQAIAELAPLSVELVPLRHAVGRTLGADVRSSTNHPPFPNSAMDGFAVGPVDGTNRTRFSIIGESRAGVPFQAHLGRGQAIRIATGAVVPEGVFAVVPVERVVDSDELTVTFDSPPQSGAHIRPPGRDISEGHLAFQRGTLIEPRMIAMLAMLGAAEVPVFRRPTVAIVTTGDELVEPERPDPLEPGKIRDSNASGLAAMCRAIGADVVVQERAGDTAEDLDRALARATEAEFVILSGGVSVGRHDHARTVLQRRGVELVFWRVLQRPGKPLAFGTAGRTMVFALPGNPVSSAICFDQYVRPAIHQHLQQQEDPARWATALLEAPLKKGAGLYHFIRGTARVGENAQLLVRETGAQDSNLISSIVQANCLIHVPEERQDPGAGEAVQIEWFRY